MLDFVHDTQATHRLLVSSLSRPGTVVNAAATADRITPAPPCNPTLMLIAHTLLDGETGFAVVADDDAVREATTNAISRRTYAHAAIPEQAGFVFVLAATASAGTALESLARGTLESPHLGATVLLEVERISVADGPSAGALLLHGPGIDGRAQVAIEPDPVWLAARNEACAEYPFGIDLFVVDSAGRILGLPRTTRISPAGGA